MKKLLILPFLLLSACVTTRTTNPDGSVVTVTRQDPKVVKAIAGAVGKAAADAAAAAIQNEIQKQNGN